MTIHDAVGPDAGVTPAGIGVTEEIIRPYIRLTPVMAVDAVDIGLPDVTLFLKLELMQHSGSFKVRGAFANLLLRKPKRVVAASGGNHGVAVAFAAQKLGIEANIFVPTISSPAKVERIRGYGAHLIITGERYADALAASEEWVSRSGDTPIHAFDQKETLLGQGTLGLELEKQVLDLDAVLVSVGGGGLIGGIAGWFGQRAEVVGVEPEASPTLTCALAAGRPVDAETGGIAADSLAPRRVGELGFPIAQKFVRRVVLVRDQDIQRAQLVLWDLFRIVAEPGGAAAFAALLSGGYRPARRSRIGIVICGGNTTDVEFGRSRTEIKSKPAGGRLLWKSLLKIDRKTSEFATRPFVREDRYSGRVRQPDKLVRDRRHADTHDPERGASFRLEQLWPRCG
jgi:threonine dehydratase